MARKLCSNRRAVSAVGQCAVSSSSVGLLGSTARVTYSVSRRRLFTFDQLPCRGSATPPRRAIQIGEIGATDSARAEDACGRVRGGGCRDQVVCAVKSEIGCDLSGAGNHAAGDCEQFDAGGGNQDVMSSAKGLEKRNCGGREFRMRGGDARSRSRSIPASAMAAIGTRADKAGSMAAGGAGWRHETSIAMAIGTARRARITMCYDRRGVRLKGVPRASVLARKATLAQLVERLIRNQ